MFIERKEHEPIKWPVKCKEPLDGGITRKHQFIAHFLLLDADQISEYSGQGDRLFVEKILVGWDNLVDADNEPIPFGAEMRDYLARVTWVKNAIVTAYYQMANGIDAKNS